MRHEFENVYNLQWSSQGLPYNSARSDFVCKNCGIKFSHYYHLTPNIYEAMKEVGIDIDGCKETKEEK
jgi:hypothetical protein